MRASILVLIFFFLTVGLSAQESVEEEQFEIVTTKAEYPGGTKELAKFLQENLKYPKDALKNNISGKVFLRAIVEKDGKLKDIEVIRSVHPSLDAEALRLVKSMPKWTPATQRGQAVRSKIMLPIVFMF